MNKVDCNNEQQNNQTEWKTKDYCYFRFGFFILFWMHSDLQSSGAKENKEPSVSKGERESAI